MALNGFHVYVSHLKCDITNTILLKMKAIFKTFSPNEIFLWSFVSIDYNHVEFSLILTHGTYKKSLFFKQNERNFILIFYILSRGYNSFQENCKKITFRYIGFSLFLARNVILVVFFVKFIWVVHT